MIKFGSIFLLIMFWHLKCIYYSLRNISGPDSNFLSDILGTWGAGTQDHPHRAAEKIWKIHNYTSKGSYGTNKPIKLSNINALRGVEHTYKSKTP